MHLASLPHFLESRAVVLATMLALLLLTMLMVLAANATGVAVADQLGDGAGVRPIRW